MTPKNSNLMNLIIRLQIMHKRCYLCLVFLFTGKSRQILTPYHASDNTDTRIIGIIAYQTKCFCLPNAVMDQ